MDEIYLYQQSEWPLFFKAKFINAISKYSSSSVLDPDYVFWNYLKVLVNNTKCVTNIVNIVNLYIDLGCWLLHFKKSTSIIISKQNKLSYNITKIFWPIFLLNILGKLIENVISIRLQAYAIDSNFIYSNQLEDIKQYYIINASIYLIYLI